MKTFESYYDFLTQLENETGYQTYDQRTDSSGVETPYIVVQRLSSNNILADNKILVKRDQLSINLHTYQENHSSTGEKMIAEKKLEDFLGNCGYIFEKEDDWLDDINLYRISYEVEIAYD